MSVLSKRHGGSSPIRTYCKYYADRPKDIRTMTICSGLFGGCRCPDFEACMDNMPDKPKYNLVEIHYKSSRRKEREH